MPTSLRDISGLLVGSISIRIVVLSNRRSSSARYLRLNKSHSADAEYFVASKSVVTITSLHPCFLPRAGTRTQSDAGGCRKRDGGIGGLLVTLGATLFPSSLA
jgi:hypothetical protein